MNILGTNSPKTYFDILFLKEMLTLHFLSYNLFKGRACQQFIFPGVRAKFPSITDTYKQPWGLRLKINFFKVCFYRRQNSQ